MKVKTVLAAAALGLALTGPGYAVCDQTALNFHYTWPEKSTAAENTAGAPNGNVKRAGDDSQPASGTVSHAQAEAGNGAGSQSSAACN